MQCMSNCSRRLQLDSCMIHGKFPGENSFRGHTAQPGGAGFAYHAHSECPPHPSPGRPPKFDHSSSGPAENVSFSGSCAVSSPAFFMPTMSHSWEAEPSSSTSSIAASSTAGRDPADLAAMFIYQNRTGYNGLFRLNARGDFNVPAGRARPRICDEDRLRAASRALNGPFIHVGFESFDGLAGVAASGDLVYFDPPYAPLSSTSRFTSYTAASFTDADQEALQRLVLDLAGRGCHVVVSNSSAPLVTDLHGSRAAREHPPRRSPAREQPQCPPARPDRGAHHQQCQSCR